MADEDCSGKERFCWVKAIMQAPSCSSVTDPGRPWTLACVDGPAGLPPPPLPGHLADASGAAGKPALPQTPVRARGAGTPPPNTNALPRTPASTESSKDPRLANDYWTAASFAPGLVPADGAPVVTLVFQPIAGSREDVKAWRLQNPEWFEDAVAVTLLGYAF